MGPLHDRRVLVSAPTRLDRAGDAVQWIVGVAAATAVVMLFTLDGGMSPPASTRAVAPADDTTLAEGATIYAAQCATCHGARGEGGVGSVLAGTVAARYPDPADAENLVAAGRLGMPSFSGSLRPDEIAAVVAFTREALG